MAKKKELNSEELDKVSGGRPDLTKPETDVDNIPLMVETDTDENLKKIFNMESGSNKEGKYKLPTLTATNQMPIKDIFAKLYEAFRNMFN